MRLTLVIEIYILEIFSISKIINIPSAISISLAIYFYIVHKTIIVIYYKYLHCKKCNKLFFSFQYRKDNLLLFIYFV